MKKIILLAIIILPFRPYAQTEKGREQAKDYVRVVNRAMIQYAGSDQIEQAEEQIKIALKGCDQQQDHETCLAGIYFSAAHLYQQAAKEEPQTTRYAKLAEKYYQRVLKIYPDNQDAWSNLIKLKEINGLNESTIDLMQRLADEYPDDRVNYLIRIGDLYRAEGNFDQACSYYQQAYEDDPFSEKACGAITRLYRQSSRECFLGQKMISFAYHCQSIGLPNYAEEILSKAIELAVKSNDETMSKNLIVVWADIMAENQWLEPNRVDQLLKTYTLIQGVAEILTELRILLLEGEVMDGFWRQKSPRIQSSESGHELSPLVVMLKILFSRGDQAYFSNDLAAAESWWNKALHGSAGFHNSMYTLIAKNLAQLYSAHPELDPGSKKVKLLVRDLFEMKGEAYASRDLEMIREYHITLSGIFYDQKIWEGGGAANAQFQLEHALSERFGPIINPTLRQMLGNVYHEIGRPEKATETYLLAVQDLLSLDYIDEAEKSLHATLNYVRNHQQNGIAAKANNLKSLIQMRREWINSPGEVIARDQDISIYLSRIAKIEKEDLTNLDAIFVSLQYFKGLCDLAARLSQGLPSDQQIIYSEAIRRIQNIDMLSTAADFRRLQNLKNCLEKSVDRSRKLQSIQITKQMDEPTWDRYQNETYKIFKLPDSQQQIQIPVSLFELSGVIQSYYRVDASQNVPEIEYNRKSFQVKKNR